ncbi:NXPE family member 2-like [Anguilla anguilla]|uniref:NXPE family member 2-like n=1 Tax=Anguilla anguilla TaxID=7936 RepID=UPI0015A99B93|nr:NXPE family member 2-like [Anguilla anguilla]
MDKSTEPVHLALVPVRCRGNLLIKTLLFIFIFVISFSSYLSGTYNWTTLMEPAKNSFREMSVEDIMRSVWDDLPPAGKFSSIESSSSGQHSVVNLEQPGAQYCVGDSVNVLVNMKDHRGNPKVHGGDFILARIHSPNLQASASGEVTDLLNGSYRVRFRLFWPGDVLVSVLLMHSSEAVGILRRISAHNYDKVIYTGTFYSGNKTEESQCGIRLTADKPLCEYRKKEDAEYYACVRPETLPCSTLRTMSSRNGPISNMTRDERLLLSRKIIGIEMRNSFGPVKVISCPAGTHRPTEKCVAGFGMTSPSPSGYFLKNRWSSTSCQTGNFFSAGAISRCLKGRNLKLMGDSTVRQWQEELSRVLKGLKCVKPYDVHSSALAVDPQRNITVQWKMHSHPFVIGNKVVKDALGYVSREVDRVAVGDVVVIGVGQHFRPFPLEIFVQRLINMRKAILRLHERSPQTLVVIKLENTREFNSVMTHLSDWFGYVQNLAQRKVFRDLKVLAAVVMSQASTSTTFRSLNTFL